MPESKKKKKVPADDEDLCGCDADFVDVELSADEDLPASHGGVAVNGDPEDFDGCDIFFGSGAGTLDEELPEATGGVA